ncbi:hypothetical protein [Streptomyces cinereospinus]|uniref:Uncharacterized protein n=1 Tax=Streptomyces cinereospinus TaxID=285561 RepID=A0ABV5MVF8_9ACTN
MATGYRDAPDTVFGNAAGLPLQPHLSRLVRNKTLEGQASARERGRHGGRPEALDADLVAMARDLYARRVPVDDIRRKLIIPTGKRAGQHPSRATVYRALATVLRPRGDTEETEAESTA